MKLEANLSGTALEGTLYYRVAEHAFDFAPAGAADLTARTGPSGTTSIALGTLQLELDVASYTLLYAWGYCPRGVWISKELPKPELRQAVVRLVHDSTTLQPGVAIELPEAKRWSFAHDLKSNWVYCGETQLGTSAIEIASGIGLVIRDGALDGVWLHPSVD